MKLILVLLFFSCIDYQIQNLEPKLISKIEIGDGIEKINASLVNNAILNIPNYIPIQNNRIYISDFINSRIKIFKLDGSLDLIYGNKKEEKYKVIYQKFNKLGILEISEDQEVYIQNFLSSKTEEQKKELYSLDTSGKFDTKEKEFIPSYIIHIDQKGKQISILGQNGRNTEPFRYIENIYSFKKNKIFVYHKSAEQMKLSLYIDDKLVKSLTEEKIEVLKKDKQDYILKLDKMIPNFSNEYALVSITYLGKSDKRFKFRRIYKFDLEAITEPILLKEIIYPSEVLFYSKRNEDFIIWETEEESNSVKLKIHDKNGNHISNQRFEFDSLRINWRETFMDAKENLYSIKIESNKLEIYNWN